MQTDTENNVILRIAGITDDSIVDGPGIRLTVFVQGCPHNCEGCHNPQTHDFADGTDITLGEIMDRINANPLLDGVTFSGGEPFCQAAALSKLGRMIREKGLNIITYSGYTYEYLTEHSDSENSFGELLDVSDHLVDGPFVLAERDLTLKFRGSKNQRIIDLKRSAECGRAVTADI
ncbi:MAG: anaerobic ribonucleoside-triphosphate reductase activating protein [Huintestinicola sp.]|uniref:anaerobic ribonucleoside-triphosphate reductase activating protein n=1 Tax=Huintestinicola sp. TaxID=2981661 RepID=UPI003F0B702A